MKRFALAALLLFAGTLQAQSVKLPAEVKVATGRMAAVAIDYDGDAIQWDTPPELDCFREYDPDPKKVRLRFIGYVPGKYRLLAIACKGSKLSDFAACSIIVGEPGPTPPPVPPTPIPPAPIDALLQDVQLEYDRSGDADKRQALDFLAIIFGAAKESVNDPAIVDASGFQEVMRTAADMKIKGKLVALRQRIWQEFMAVLPNQATPLTPSTRQALETLCKRVSATLWKVK